MCERSNFGACVINPDSLEMRGRVSKRIGLLLYGVKNGPLIPLRILTSLFRVRDIIRYFIAQLSIAGMESIDMGARHRNAVPARAKRFLRREKIPHACAIINKYT